MTKQSALSVFVRVIRGSIPLFARRSVGCLLVLSLAALAGCSPIRWERDYEAGLRRAAQQHRRAVVQFYSPFNADCRVMDDEVLSNTEIQRYMAEYIPIRLDSVLNRRLMEQFGVQVLPTFVIVRPDMQVAGSQSGFMDVEKFGYFLIKHRHN